MAVEIYKGRYVTAESATNYIDSGAISTSCSKIKDAASQLTKTGKKTLGAKSYCSKKHLSIEGNTMEDDIELCACDYEDAANYMETFADTILGALEKALDKKQLKLNAEAQRKDAEIIKQVEARQAARKKID